MTQQLPWLDAELKQLTGQGLLRRKSEYQPLPDGWCLCHGKKLKNFASNDYLNLAHDSRVIASAQQALSKLGVGARASALVCGRTTQHAALEQKLAAFENQEAAILFPTGFAANMGTIGALVNSEDTVFSDRLNHASLIDGCRISSARLRVYRHDSLDRLERELEKESNAPRRWIVTDSVFSMDGTIAPLTELCDLAEKHDANLIVDEAHATGVFGKHGRGIAELQGVEDQIAVRIGTLSKAVGVLGGFVTGPQSLIDWLWNKGRTQIYSTALPPAMCAAAATSLEIIEQKPQRREKLLMLGQSLRTLLEERGLETVTNSCGPIVPVILGAPEKTVSVAEKLQEAGFLVPAIRPPTVPENTARLRISLTCAHEEHDLLPLVNTIAELVHD